MTRWLVFPDDGYRWLRLDGDSVVARGTELASIPRDDTQEIEVVAVVSGTSVVIHWVELPALAPAQAYAAAQMLAADVCGGSFAATHVAVGETGCDGTRPLALVDKSVMQGWLDALAASDLVVTQIVALPLLLPAPGDIGDAPFVFETAGVVHLRGHRLAASAEPALATVMLAGRDTVAIDAARFEAGLPMALSAVPLDLRQGEFALKSPVQLDRRQLRRIGAMTLAIAALWIGTQGAALLRDSLAADRVEQQAADEARAVLPRGTAIDAPRAQVAARAARLGAGGQGFAELAVPLLTVMRDRASVVLQSLRYAPDTGLAAVVVTPSPEDREALATGLGSVGRMVTVGEPRGDSGATVVDVLVRPK
jgi:general secretion pathway protein L